jgi:hypothetical protein
MRHYAAAPPADAFRTSNATLRRTFNFASFLPVSKHRMVRCQIRQAANRTLHPSVTYSSRSPATEGELLLQRPQRSMVCKIYRPIILCVERPERRPLSWSTHFRDASSAFFSSARAPERISDIP